MTTHSQEFVGAIDKLGLSAKQVAERLGVTVSTIGNIKRGLTWKKGIPDALQAAVTDIIAEAMKINGHASEAAVEAAVGTGEPIELPTSAPAPTTTADTTNGADTNKGADALNQTEPTSDSSAEPSDSAEPMEPAPDSGLSGIIEDIKALKETDERTAYAIIRRAIRSDVGELGRARVIKELAKSLKVAPGKVEKIWEKLAPEVAMDAIVPPTADELAAAEKAAAEAMAAAQAAADAQAKAESDALYAKCKHIAEDTWLIDRMVKAVQLLGVVEEGRAIVAIYLAATSRLNRRRAMSLLRRGSAASGKSFVVDQVLKLFPASEVVSVSGASPKSLAYYGGDDPDSLKHKIVYIIEAAAIADKAGVENEFATQLRVLISEGKLEYLVAVAQEGGTPVTIAVKKDGPIATIITSARSNIEEELLTRLSIGDADESDAQTKQIALAALSDEDGEPASAAADVEGWRAFQEWLSAGGPYVVSIPFLGALKAVYERSAKSHPLRFRRDIGAFLTAIRTSAIVHRAQRQFDARGRIVAELIDYRVAAVALNNGLAELYGAKVPKVMKRVIEGVEKFVAREEVDRKKTGVAASAPFANTALISIRALKNEIGLSSQGIVSERLREAVALELIEVVNLGRPYGQTETKRYKVLVPSAGIDTAASGAGVFPSAGEIEAEMAAAPGQAP